MLLVSLISSYIYISKLFDIVNILLLNKKNQRFLVNKRLIQEMVVSLEKIN